MSGDLPKLVIVGDGGVGKTSIITRYIKDKFTQGYEPTLEDNYTTKIKISDTETLEVEIADTAGQEDYKPLRDKYMVEGELFFVVYSIIDARSLQMAENLLEQIKSLKEGEPFKFILIGNKCDLTDQRSVPQIDGQNLANKFGGKFFETSALSKQNIDEVFRTIGKLYLEKGSKSETGGCCIIV